MTAAHYTRIHTHSADKVVNNTTAPVAANTQLFKGTMVARDSSGNAIEPTASSAAPILGVAIHYVDNRTGSEAGGGAGDTEIGLENGVYYFDLNSGDSAPLVGDPVFAVDNQTLSPSSNGGLRGYAGPCVAVQDLGAGTQVGVLLSPASIVSRPGSVLVPLGGLRLSTGAAIPAFADGSADGYQLTDSEALSLRVNDDSTTVFVTSVPLPENLVGPVEVHFLVSRVGTSDTTAAITVGAFFQTAGVIHSGDANAGGATSAVATNSVVNDVSVVLAAADVPAGPCVLTLTMQVTAALDADDLLIHGIYLKFNTK